MADGGAWLRGALDALAASSLAGRDRRQALFCAFAVDRQGVVGALRGEDLHCREGDAQADMERYLLRIAKWQGCDRIGVGRAVQSLKDAGFCDIARRLRAVSRVRNGLAHPDVGFLEDLESALASSPRLEDAPPLPLLLGCRRHVGQQEEGTGVEMADTMMQVSECEEVEVAPPPLAEMPSLEDKPAALSQVGLLEAEVRAERVGEDAMKEATIQDVVGDDGRDMRKRRRSGPRASSTWPAAHCSTCSILWCQ